jgi:hypothetical protein
VMVWNVGGSNEERFPMKNWVIRGLERRKKKQNNNNKYIC